MVTGRISSILSHLKSVWRIDMPKVGDKIRIIEMQGEPRYCGREGVVTHVDDMNQIHGTWGGLALIPGEDTWVVVENGENNE